MKNKKHAALILPDLRNGLRGSLWFSNGDRNVPGKLPIAVLRQVIDSSPPPYGS